MRPLSLGCSHPRKGSWPTLSGCNRRFFLASAPANSSCSPDSAALAVLSSSSLLATASWAIVWSCFILSPEAREKFFSFTWRHIVLTFAKWLGLSFRKVLPSSSSNITSDGTLTVLPTVLTMVCQFQGQTPWLAGKLWCSKGGFEHLSKENNMPLVVRLNSGSSLRLNMNCSSPLDQFCAKVGGNQLQEHSGSGSNSALQNWPRLLLVGWPMLSSS